MDSLHLCDDKERFNNILVENNFGNYIPKMLYNPQYPYILKKKEDQWGSNSHIIINSEQERQWLEKISSPDYFKQQLGPGQKEYATHLIYSEGRIINSLTIEYIFDAEYYIKGKNREVSRQKVERCPYHNIFSSILGFIGFEGLCCINFKIIDSQPLIFEINPRFGGSLSPHFYDFIKGLL
jgi:carbamoylphosphate synthase large subunit